MTAEDRLAAALRDLGHPHRVRLLGLLAAGPMTATELLRALGLAHHAVLVCHARPLLGLGLVEKSPRGQSREYTLTASGAAVLEAMVVFVRALGPGGEAGGA